MFHKVKRNALTALAVGLMMLFAARPAEAGVLKFLERTVTFPARLTGYVLSLFSHEMMRGGLEAEDDLD